MNQVVGSSSCSGVRSSESADAKFSYKGWRAVTIQKVLAGESLLFSIDKRGRVALDLGGGKRLLIADDQDPGIRAMAALPDRVSAALGMVFGWLKATSNPSLVGAVIYVRSDIDTLEGDLGTSSTRLEFSLRNTTNPSLGMKVDRSTVTNHEARTSLRYDPATQQLGRLSAN